MSKILIVEDDRKMASAVSAHLKTKGHLSFTVHTVQDAIESTIDVSAFNTELDLEKADAATLQAMRSEVISSFTDLFENGDLAPE